MGFSSTLFIKQPVEEELLCALCLEIFDRPVNSCAEGHTFCAACLSRAQAQASDATCPQCRGELFANAPPNRPLQNMISKLAVRCKNAGAGSDGPATPLAASPVTLDVPENSAEPTELPAKQHQTTAAASVGASDNDSEPTEPPLKQRKTKAGASVGTPARMEAGCGWTGTLEQLDNHLKTCTFVRIRCPLEGCSCRIVKEELAAHQEVCEYRKIACPACHKQVTARAMQRHSASFCPEREVECEYCKEKMTASALGTAFRMSGIVSMDHDAYLSAWTGHLAECPHAEVRCEFWSIGCKEKVKRSELAAHHTAHASKHACLAVKKFASMEQEMHRQLQMQQKEMLWEEMMMSWDIPVDKFAGTSRTVIKSTGPLTAGFKMHLRMDVPQNDGDLKISLCTEQPPWSPVRVRDVSIFVRERSDRWDSGNRYRGNPRFHTRAATLTRPDYSCGGFLQYDVGESDSDSESEYVSTDLNRGDVYAIAVSGLLKLRAKFKVKRVTSVTCKCT